MEWYHYLLIVVGVVLAALITVVLIRTAMFRPQAEAPIEDFPVTCNEEKAVYALQQMIRCKTVSYVDENREDDAEFDKFYAFPLEGKGLLQMPCYDGALRRRARTGRRLEQACL